MENNIALPSGNDGTGIFNPSSRKRKLIDTDAEVKFGNQFPYELNQQRGSFPLPGGQGHARQSWLYPSDSLKSNSIGNQIQMDQRPCQNYSLQSQSSSNGYSYHGVIRNSPFIMSSQSSKHDRALLFPMLAREMPGLLISAPQDYSMLNRNETSEPTSLPKSCNIHIGNSDIERSNLVKYGINKFGKPALAAEIGKVSPESLRSVATVSISFPDGFNRRTCSEEEKNIGSAWESRMCCQDSVIARNSSYPSELADNSRLLALESGMQKPSQNVLKNGSAGENLGTEEQRQKGSNVDFMKRTETINDEDIKESCIEESIKDGSMLTKSIMHAQSIKQTSGSSKLLEKEMSSPANSTSSVPEKLWNGSLQLNSSITASAVAFYKSGERLLDVNWSECVEVKGKVRLEAFEKYIQDLPRSRTRGLMVTSMCWKKGSSEKELRGMKEVAKAYRKCERVGFAKLSPSVDVYLCPPSDTIITILAKHGFFNGSAAAEDKSEVFLGCVVWRKNQMPSASVKKISENANSLSQQIVKTCSSSVSSHALVDCSSDLGSVNVTESKGVEVCKMSSANISVGDDDDLPEFDFKVACKTEQNRKKLFCDDDDDDMPEWLPPKPQIMSLNPTSRDPPQQPSGFVPPPRHPVGPMPRLDHESRGLHGQLPNVKVAPPHPFQNALTGFAYTPDLRLPSGSFAAKHHPIPGNFRGWRPF